MKAIGGHFTTSTTRRGLTLNPNQPYFTFLGFRVEVGRVAQSHVITRQNWTAAPPDQLLATN